MLEGGATNPLAVTGLSAKDLQLTRCYLRTLQALQRMADVYMKKAELEKSKEEASQIRRNGLDLYLRSFRLQRTPELFRSMLIVAIIEGEGKFVRTYVRSAYVHCSDLEWMGTVNKVAVYWLSADTFSNYMAVTLVIKDLFL